VRILILWQHREDEQARIILVTNRVQWEQAIHGDQPWS
jgi:hypothetical protein